MSYRLLLKIVMFMFIFFANNTFIWGASINGTIVFSTVEDSPNSIVRIIHLDNKDTWKNPLELFVSNKGCYLRNPVWFPDGNKILFQFYNAVEDDQYLAYINIENPVLKRLETPIKNILPKKYTNDFFRFPSISPDGSKLGLLVSGEKGFKLIIFSFDSKNTTLCKKDVSESSIFWSPDSNKWLRLFGQGIVFYKWSLAAIPVKPHRANTPDNRNKPHPGLIRQA